MAKIRVAFIATLPLLGLVLVLAGGSAWAATEAVCNCCSGGNTPGCSHCCSGPNGQGGLGCDDSACQTVVCGQDPFCCSVNWDVICDAEGLTLCSCCPPDTDGDGVVDACDPCPSDPDADHDGYSVTGGCPPGVPADCDDSNAYCTTNCTDADGDGFCVTSDCNDSNAHCVLDCTDADGDGFCAPYDCDDSDPACGTACGDADGDGVSACKDCDDSTANCGLDCTDADGDGVPACKDCNDAKPHCTTNCTDADGDGFCLPLDCNDSSPGCTTVCVDADGDGVPACADCDDAKPHCTANCTDADGDGFCLPLDCNDSNASCTTNCADADGDGLCVGADCDDALATCTTDCTDGDHDGVCPPFDCNDQAPHCAFNCADGDGDGICNDQDNCPATPNPNQGFPTKLNGTLLGSSSDVQEFAVTPDSAKVVYRAEQDKLNKPELYRVLIGGGVTAKVNGPVVGSVWTWTLSPDGARAVYLDFVTNKSELYSAPVSGGGSVKLNGPLVSGGDFADGDYAVSPDSTRVVYLVTQEVFQTFELYSVPIGGGTPVKLNGPLVTGGDVSTFKVSPDALSVIYVADQQANDVLELYSVPIGGGTPVKLNGPLVSGGDVSSSSLLVSPNSTRVVYRADQQVNDVFELYSVPIGGGTPVKLNGPLVSGGDVSSSSLLVSPDSTRVVYLADQDVDEQSELYGAPIGGGAPVKLNGPLVTGGDVSTFKVSPDGSRVIYVADQQVNDVLELYSVPIGGGTPVKLNGPLVASGDVSGFLISADGARVVYEADQDADTVVELYSVPAAGGTPIKLNGTLVSGGDVSISGLRVSPDSARVFYVADQELDGRFELYRVPIAGGTPIKLNGPLVAGGVVSTAFLVSPDSGSVVYLADQDVDGKNEIYRVSANVDPAGIDGDLDGHGAVCDCDEGDATCAADCSDADGDGLRQCDGDCNNANPKCTTNCTDADGDGFCVTTDCNEANPNCTANCTDADGDGFCVTTDCNEANPNCTANCTDADGDGFCVTTDCDDSISTCNLSCVDADGDGLAACNGDCNDANVKCTTDCTDTDGDGYCVTTDCNDAKTHCTTDCTDADGDGFCGTTDCDDGSSTCNTSCVDADGDGLRVCDGDCDDANPDTPIEVCTDGVDNDCNDQIDAADAACAALVASNLRFTGQMTLAWDAAPSAAAYALYRGTIPERGLREYDHVCEGTLLSGTTAEDPDTPPRGEGFYYLVAGQETTAGLRIGPLGSRSDGVSVPDSDAVTCGPRVYVDRDNTSATHDGLSWATAYKNLSAALSFAAHPGRGLEVWLRVSATVDDQPALVAASLRPGLRILGGFAGTEAASWERPTGTRTALEGSDQGFVIRSQGASVGLERVTLSQATHGLRIQPAGVWLEVADTVAEQLSGYAVFASGPLRRAHVEDNTWDASAGEGGLRIVLASGTLTGRVAHNAVLGGSVAGLDLEARASASGDAEMSLDVLANTIAGGGTGIVLLAGSTSVPHVATQSSFVGSNLVYGTSGDAVDVEAQGTFAQVDVGTVSARPLIVGNTVSDGGAAGVSCAATRTGDASGNSVRCQPQIWDNLITFHAGSGIEESADDAVNGIVADPVLVVGNDLHGNAVPYRDEGATDLVSMAEVNALPEAYDNYDAEPGYVDRISGDYHLAFGTLLGPGTAMRYLANTSDPGLGMDWSGSFDDTSWPTGTFGVGYDSGSPPNALNLLATEVGPGTVSIYTRTTFAIPDASSVESLTLGLDFDDGVVAWINGVEVFRSASMPPGALAWNSVPTSHESGNGPLPAYESYDISATGVPALVDGENVVALGVWNTSAASDDLVLVPRLVLNAELATIDAGHADAPRMALEDLDGESRTLDGDKDGVALPDTGADER